MTTEGCETVRDLVPDWVRGALDPAAARRVAAHAAACEACAGEAEVVRALLREPVEVPVGLEARIVRAVVGSAPPWHRRHARPLALAATVAGVLLLGRSVLDREPEGAAPRGADATTPEPASTALGASLEPPYSGWPGADGVLAGSVVLHDLSEEELEALLLEMDS